MVLKNTKPILFYFSFSAVFLFPLYILLLADTLWHYIPISDLVNAKHEQWIPGHQHTVYMGELQKQVIKIISNLSYSSVVNSIYRVWVSSSKRWMFDLAYFWMNFPLTSVMGQIVLGNASHVSDKAKWDGSTVFFTWCQLKNDAKWRTDEDKTMPKTLNDSLF